MTNLLARHEVCQADCAFISPFVGRLVQSNDSNWPKALSHSPQDWVESMAIQKLAQSHDLGRDQYEGLQNSFQNSFQNKEMLMEDQHKTLPRYYQELAGPSVHLAALRFGEREKRAPPTKPQGASFQGPGSRQIASRSIACS